MRGWNTGLGLILLWTCSPRKSAMGVNSGRDENLTCGEDVLCNTCPRSVLYMIDASSCDRVRSLGTGGDALPMR